MAVLICNAISTGSWNSPQENDSRQMIVKSGEKNGMWLQQQKSHLLGYVFTAELLSWCPQFGNNKAL